MKNKQKKQNTSLQNRAVLAEGINIIKKYRSSDIVHEVLKGVSLHIREKEIVAIVGPSGCGKTTLLNCLSGIDTIDSGEIYFEGESMEGLNEAALTKLRSLQMGFVFQSFNLIPVLSVVENIELPMLAAGKKAREAREKATELIKILGLEGKENQKPNELSGGEKQRVAIGRALINDPKIVWADEPTGNLDTNTTEEIIALIQKLNKEKGITFVIVTHDLNVAVKSGRIIRMDSGRIV